ncbi:MAG: hypothetical protein F4Z55_08310 [Boseongicola sp. SB0667_bin_21]|nr:hypothetical protein [Boseongicola sp. SB0667_bin_21]
MEIRNENQANPKRLRPHSIRLIKEDGESTDQRAILELQVKIEGRDRTVELDYNVLASHGLTGLAVADAIRKLNLRLQTMEGKQTVQIEHFRRLRDEIDVVCDILSKAEKK